MSNVVTMSLTIAQDEVLERIQKVSLKVILGPAYVNYQSALSVLELETLKIRREKLCISFAKKCIKSQRHIALWRAINIFMKMFSFESFIIVF